MTADNRQRHLLGRSVHRLPVMLLCACRPLPRPPDLERLITSLTDQGPARIVLGPLDDHAVAALVETLVGATPGPRLLRQVPGAGGNPLFVMGEEPTRLRFRHDVLRETLYQDLPGAVRPSLHLDAARALARAGAPAEQVAEHLLRGAVPGDAEAVSWLREAAGKVASHAPTVAADPDDPGRDQLLAEQAMSLMWSGSVLEAERLCRQALGRGPDPAVGSQLRLCLAQALPAMGRSQEALPPASRENDDDEVEWALRLRPAPPRRPS